MTWTPATPLSELPRGGSALFVDGRDRIAIFRTTDGELFAIDDRCPHEGYPLSQGALDGCTLTCCWHNYKFDIRSGGCLLGDEDVRTYPLRVQGDRVELDLTPPDPTVTIARAWEGLDRGLLDDRPGQAARELVRLLAAGVPPVDIAVFLAAWDGSHAEYGASHALPVAVDALRWLDRYPGPRAALPLMQAADMARRTSVRRPVRPVPSPVDPGDPATFRARLGTAVEREQVAEAEALLRGALRAGFTRDQVEPALFDLCAAHFLDYGHATIYQIKAFDLLEAAGWHRAEDVLPGHLVAIVLGTREDVLPTWKGWRRRLAAVVDELPDLDGKGEALDDEALHQAVLDGRGKEAFDAVMDALRSGASRDRIARSLCLAAAERLLRFDPRHDHDLSVQDDWLSVTHVQTFANAVRVAQARTDAATGNRLLLQLTRMIHMTGVLDLPVDARLDTSPRVGDLTEALRARDPARAVRIVAHAVATDPDGVWDTLRDVALDDPAVRPIVVAHVVKQVVTAWDDHHATGSALPLQACVRLLTSPIRERRVRRLTEEAIAFVTEGRIPRSLVS